MISKIGTTSFLSTVAARYVLIHSQYSRIYIFRNEAEELREKAFHELA